MNENQKRWKENHLKALEVLGFKRSQFNRLRAIENEANRNAVLYCNGDIDSHQYEARKWNTIAQVANLLKGSLPKGFFVNSDPRGYALKIDSGNEAGQEHHPEYIPQGLHKDWGGYGILAPEEF